VDLFTNEKDRVWVGVHFGSRGPGHKTATHFLNAAGAKDDVMGGMEAIGRVDRKTGAVTSAGKVTPEMMREWVTRENVELRGAGVDESPHCYKRLPDVLAEHADTIRVLETLRPIGVAMAGEEFDPYKD